MRLPNTNPGISSAGEGVKWLADKKKIVAFILSNGRNLKCDFREKGNYRNSGHSGVIQGPVTVLATCPLISSQHNHLPRRQGGEQVSGQFTRKKLRLMGQGAGRCPP